MKTLATDFARFEPIRPVDGPSAGEAAMPQTPPLSVPLGPIAVARSGTGDVLDAFRVAIREAVGATHQLSRLVSYGAPQAADIKNSSAVKSRSNDAAWRIEKLIAKFGDRSLPERLALFEDSEHFGGYFGAVVSTLEQASLGESSVAKAIRKLLLHARGSDSERSSASKNEWRKAFDELVLPRFASAQLSSDTSRWLQNWMTTGGVPAIEAAFESLMSGSFAAGVAPTTMAKLVWFGLGGSAQNRGLPESFLTAAEFTVEKYPAAAFAVGSALESQLQSEGASAARIWRLYEAVTRGASRSAKRPIAEACAAHLRKVLSAFSEPEEPEARSYRAVLNQIFADAASTFDLVEMGLTVRNNYRYLTVETLRQLFACAADTALVRNPGQDREPLDYFLYRVEEAVPSRGRAQPVSGSEDPLETLLASASGSAESAFGDRGLRLKDRLESYLCWLASRSTSPSTTWPTGIPAD